MVSIFAKMLMKQLEKNKDYVLETDELEDFRETFDNMTSKFKLPKGVDIEEIQIGNTSGEKYSLKSKNSDDSSSRVMLYLHGGGYEFGSCKSHRVFVARLCKKLQVQAYSINYRLAPEDPYPAGLDDAFAVYKWLLEEKSIPAENIILMGDSAGGGLALCLLVRIANQNFPQPKAAITLSPWTDLTLSGETMKTKLEEEPFFNVKNIENGAIDYVGNESSDNPEVSPLFADFTGFPSIFIQVGTREILLDDSLRITEKMQEQGVNVTLDVQKGMFHAFLFFNQMPIMAFMVPEFRRAMKNVKRFVESL
ncbi:MAG: alpha/beta hydrolase [Candidatus Heimdallarchaeaceae archaeon]